MSKDIQPIRVQEIDWSSALPWLVLLKSSSLALHPPKLLLGLLMVFLLYFGGYLSDALVGTQVDPDEMHQHAALSDGELAQWQQSREAWLQGQLSQRLTWLADTGQVESMSQMIQSKSRFPLIQKAIGDYYQNEYDRLMKQAAESANPPEVALASPASSPASAESQQTPQEIALSLVPQEPSASRADYLQPVLTPQAVRQAVAQLHRERRERSAAIENLRPRGVFETALKGELAAFERLVTSATSLNFGFDDLLDRQRHVPGDTLLGSLQEMLLKIPCWLWSLHRGHLLGYLAYALLVWSLLGGAMARMSACQAAAMVSPRTWESSAEKASAIVFAAHRWLWFIACPLIPLALAAAIGWGMLTVSGFLWFNLPGLDMIGGLLFGLMLVLGMVIVLLLAGLAACIGLMTPALAVEGTDAFDVVSRCYNYVLGRPWHWAFYTLVSLVYGAICYVFVGALVFAAIAVTHGFVTQGVMADAAMGVDRFSAMLPLPQLGHLAYVPDWSLLPLTGRIAAALVGLWVYACIGLLASYWISYFLSANTWIYLLLRRSADGAEMDEIDRRPTVKPKPAEESSEGA